MKNNFKLRYSINFYEQLDIISLYIKNELKNNIAANNLVSKVEKEIIKRLENPLSYEKCKTKMGNSYYKIYIDNYTVFYTVTDNIMDVRSILYNRRNEDELI